MCLRKKHSYRVMEECIRVYTRLVINLTWNSGNGPTNSAGNESIICELLWGELWGVPVRRPSWLASAHDQL